jgi:hypothetical protein
MLSQGSGVNGDVSFPTHKPARERSAECFVTVHQSGQRRRSPPPEESITSNENILGSGKSVFASRVSGLR